MARALTPYQQVIYAERRARQRAQAAAEAAARRREWVRDEPCANCGESSERSHPGGVISRRWLCTKCHAWQPDADPKPAKVLTEEEGYGLQRPFDPSGLDVLEAPTLFDVEPERADATA